MKELVCPNCGFRQKVREQGLKQVTHHCNPNTKHVFLMKPAR